MKTNIEYEMNCKIIFKTWALCGTSKELQTRPSIFFTVDLGSLWFGLTLLSSNVFQTLIYVEEMTQRIDVWTAWCQPSISWYSPLWEPLAWFSVNSKQLIAHATVRAQMYYAHLAERANVKLVERADEMIWILFFKTMTQKSLCFAKCINSSPYEINRKNQRHLMSHFRRGGPFISLLFY